MDSGRIIERGTHKELLAMRGFYAHIFDLQNNAGTESIGEAG
jgi:ABC-type multidrug transport system fused ATPase/permease subunit